MPLITVGYDQSYSDADLEVLAKVLPSAVAQAVDRPEEPHDGPLSKPGRRPVRGGSGPIPLG